MILPAAPYVEEKPIQKGKAYLSHSRVNKYETCPEQYRLYYVENLRPRLASANLVFGSIIHQSLAVLFADQKEPIEHFIDSWGWLKDIELGYSRTDTWEKLKTIGEKLLTSFLKTEAGKISNIQGVEKPFEISITGIDVPLVGVIDLVGDIQGVSTVVDFKTSSSSYGDYEVMLSDQLTAYQIAYPTAKQLAFCVLTKTKEPRIEWFVGTRTGGDMVGYLRKLQIVAKWIRYKVFHKRPGKHCAWCDFLPICTGNTRKAKETLVQVDV